MLERFVLLVFAMPSVALFVGCAPGPGGSGTSGDAGMPPACTTAYAAVRRRPEVTLVVDQSCAMALRLDGVGNAANAANPAGRWGAVRAAVHALTPMHAAAGWGLVLYPGDDPTACDAPPLLVPPAFGSGADVDAQLAMNGIDPFAICAGGPVEVALEAALDTVGASDELGAAGEPFVLVIGTATPTCGSTMDSLLMAEAMSTELSMDVAVLALQPDAEGAPLFEALAAGGGAPNSSAPPSYYEASSAEEVQSVIAGLLADRQSCVFDLLGGPPGIDPNALKVWVDGMPVDPDPDQGWSFSVGEDSIALNGTLCERLRAGDLQRVEAAASCDAPTCVPRDESCDSLDDDCDGTIDEDCL